MRRGAWERNDFERGEVECRHDTASATSLATALHDRINVLKLGTGHLISPDAETGCVPMGGPSEDRAPEVRVLAGVAYNRRGKKARPTVCLRRKARKREHCVPRT